MTYEILTNEQMAAADRLTIEGGTAGYALMTQAGQGVAALVHERYEWRQIVVLCGPGNNGGDGFIIAQCLKDKRHDVRLACLVSVENLKGDAAEAAGNWQGAVESFEGLEIDKDELVIDAVFGTGFSREFETPVQDVFEQIEGQANDVVAVDVPSGVNGTTGEVAAFTPHAELTVTFFRKKLGHILMPGASRCGEIRLVDIGIQDTVLEQTGLACFENYLDLWREHVAAKTPESNKYSHGHVLILGGYRMTGAACMAGHAAFRIGAGLCTIAAHSDAADVYRSYLPNIIFEPCGSHRDFKTHMEDKRRNAVLIGPGAGLDDKEGLRKAITDACGCGDKKVCVFDADALTVFEENPASFHEILGPHCILTPHEGEFVRVFPDLKGNKLERTREAALISGAVVLLKGPDTVIAAPDGRVVINNNAPPTLATAGSGDVLAGMIAGLAAQGIPPFEASCAAAWMHGAAARHFGPGLMAPDIIDQIPAVLQDLS